MLLYLTPETTVEDGDNMLFAGVQSRYAKAPWRGYDVGDPNPLSDWVGSPAAENGPPTTTISCVPCSLSLFILSGDNGALLLYQGHCEYKGDLVGK